MSALPSSEEIVAAARASFAIHDILLTTHARERDIVVIAGSAGSIPPILHIVEHLPADFGTPVAVVLHRTPRSPAALSRLLVRRSALRVKDVEEGDVLAPGTVFVAPADRHLSIGDDRRLHLRDGTRIEHVRSSANPLFESAAEQFGRGVVAVVLSGSGRNGARGVEAVKAHGGTVLVQSKHTSRFFEMPAAALQTGAVDLVLPVDEIAHAIVVLCSAAHDGAPATTAAD